MQKHWEHTLAIKMIETAMTTMLMMMEMKMAMIGTLAMAAQQTTRNRNVDENAKRFLVFRLNYI